MAFSEKFQIELVTKRMEEKKQKDLLVFEWFKLHVLQSKLATSISHQELVSNLFPYLYYFKEINCSYALKEFHIILINKLCIN